MKKDLILIADDNEINCDMLEAFLEDDYEVAKVYDGQQTIDYLRTNKDVQMLLLDLYMPNKTGFEVLDEIKKMGIMNTLPVIIISGENAVSAEEKAFELGVCDFIHKPFENIIVKRRVENAIELYSSRNYLEKKVKAQTEEIRKQYNLLKAQSEKLHKTNQQIIDILGTTVEFRHMDSYEHINRVKSFTKCIADMLVNTHPELGLKQEDADLVVAASSLHDIGKISIEDSVLLKPGKLTEEEFEYMKTHTTKGCEILKRIDGVWDDEFAKTSYDICHHHERYDGNGYPDGLKGDRIPISAQIVSIADVYDALICKRVYKDAFSKDVAFSMIVNGECGVFPPVIIECFKACREELEHLAETIVTKDK